MSDRWLFGVAFVVTLLAQSWIVDGKFLSYDDSRFVERNRAIEDLSNPAAFFHDLDTTASADAPTRDIYRPLRTLTYAVITKVSSPSCV